MIAILGHYPSQFLDLETFLYFLLHLVLVDYMFSYAANTKQEMMFKDRAWKKSNKIIIKKELNLL